jgi:hypothetical protein
MRTGLIGLLAVVALVGGCASDTAFEKKGLSAGVVKKESDTCWSKAQVHNIPESHKAAAAIGGLIGGGPAGLVGALIGNEIAASDPKNGVRRKAHDECMVKRGYKVAPKAT